MNIWYFMDIFGRRSCPDCQDGFQALVLHDLQSHLKANCCFIPDRSRISQNWSDRAWKRRSELSYWAGNLLHLCYSYICIYLKSIIHINLCTFRKKCMQSMAPPYRHKFCFERFHTHSNFLDLFSRPNC